ncbi:hypothetical protein DESC_590163 [Desulfosarcina cetonica]|nr:hypothetical protein DESC_590163 [Desulfosarcina cetonica]
MDISLIMKIEKATISVPTKIIKVKYFGGVYILFVIFILPDF